MRRIVWIVCVLLALIQPAMALAHAQFRGAEPAPNALVLERPDAVTLNFSEPVSPVAMRWIAPDGASHPVGAEPGGKQVGIAPPPEAGDGSYLLVWRVVSLDGHPVSGTMVLSVGTPSEVPTLGQIDWPPPATWWVIAMKLVLSLCLILGIGGTVYSAFVARDAGRAGAVTTTALLLTFPAALLLVGAQGLDLLGLPPGAILTPEAWTTGAGTSILRTSVLSMLAALAALGLRLPRLPRHPALRPVLVLSAWALAAVGFAVSGHAAIAEPEWLAVTASIVHGLALIFWLGAFLPLAVLAWRGEDMLPQLQRFSSMAIPLVVLLIGSGFLMASIHTGKGGFQAIGLSGYGILLFVKLVAVAGLLIVATHNWLTLTPALKAGTPGAARALRGSILVEITLAVMIVAFASSFRLTPPPQTLSQEQRPLTATVREGSLRAELELNPGRVGANVAALAIDDSAADGFEPIEVNLSFFMPEQGIGPVTVPARQAENRGWSTEAFTLPVAGQWQVTIEVLVTDFDLDKLTANVTLEP